MEWERGRGGRGGGCEGGGGLLKLHFVLGSPEQAP